MAKKKKQNKKTNSANGVIALDMKGLREEVIKQVNKLMKGGDVMQFEMKFDRQEGFEFKALKDSKVPEYTSGCRTFDEDGVLVGNAIIFPSDNYADGFPQELYDMYDDMKLKI